MAANPWDPIYIPTITYYGGVIGADPGRPDAPSGFTPSTANCTNDFTPRKQNDKLSAGNWTAGAAAAADIGRDRGSIAPNQRYPLSGDAAVPAPTVASLSPSTGAAAAMPITVTITGTNFTPYSNVHTGGQGNAAQSTKYLSATQMQVTLQPGTVAGTVGIAVSDHSVMSNSVNFTVT
jgi:hypothetical protein